MEPFGLRRRPTGMKTIALTAVTAALLLSTSACSDTGGGELSIAPATVVVTVDWLPPSTPDQYQDTETLTLSRHGIDHQVRTDGRTTEPMDQQRWEDFVAALPAALDEITDAAPGETCVGAGGSTLTVTGAGEHDRTVTTTICGGKQSPRAVHIDELVADFR